MDLNLAKSDARFTVSVPTDLLQLFDQKVEAKKTSRSKLVAKAMADEVFNEK